MKNRTLLRFLIAGLALCSTQAFAQLPAIDSLKLIPANPTSNDVLKVVCYTTFPSGSCSVNHIHSEQQGNNILLMLDYTVGAASYICNSVDTILIDNPGAGSFQLITTIAMNEQDIIEDIDSLNFTVDPFLGIPEFGSNNFITYPNPFENELHFKTNFAVESLKIHTISGQKVLLKESVSNTLPIDVSNLEPGIYLITLIDNGGNKFTQRIIKSSNN